MSVDLELRSPAPSSHSSQSKRKSPSPLSSSSPSIPSPSMSAHFDSPRMAKRVRLLDLADEDSDEARLTPSPESGLPSRVAAVRELQGRPPTIGSPPAPLARRPLPRLALPEDDDIPLFGQQPLPKLSLMLPEADAPPAPSAAPALTLLLPDEPTPAPASSPEVVSGAEEFPGIQCIPFDESSPPAAASEAEPTGHAHSVSYFLERCLVEQPSLQQSVLKFLEENGVVLIQVLASGANGVTFEGEKNGVPVVFKALFRPEAIAPNRGNHLLQGLSHSSLIQVRAICKSGEQLLGVLMEKAKGSTLKSLTLTSANDYLTRLAAGGSASARAPEIPARKFLKIAKGIAAGLNFLKENGLLHRDIQPNNILIDQEGNVKIIDFDLLRKDDGACTEIVGAQSYQAPEMPWTSASGSYSYPVDAYSFGKVLHLLAGKTNWTGLEHLQASARDIIRGLMNQDPKNRTEIGLAYEQFQKLASEASL